uniref:Uncharacterized protein n=1 Tax=Nelumbo nucifera TaxID=4432 RepID=A0A822YL65_NELNU|nr:TPA_asm: hypothetical protein HUJ06_012181 [Nelumbo nucifera]
MIEKRRGTKGLTGDQTVGFLVDSSGNGGEKIAAASPLFSTEEKVNSSSPAREKIVREVESKGEGSENKREEGIGGRRISSRCPSALGSKVEDDKHSSHHLSLP